MEKSAGLFKTAQYNSARLPTAVSDPFYTFKENAHSTSECNLMW